MRLVYREQALGLETAKTPLLQDLYEELLRQPEPEARRVATALELYCTGSLNLFNHPTNVKTDSRVVCIVLKNMGENLRKIAMHITNEFVSQAVDQNFHEGAATWCYFDEFHILLRDPLTASYFVAVWKMLRKKGCVPSALTQNVKDLLASREIENILDNTDFMILLSQAQSDRTILAKQLGISEHQLSYITHSNSGEGLLFYGNVTIPFVVKYTNTDMIAAFFDLSGPVTVARDADGITTISATFYDESGEKKTIVYKNELKLMNTTSGATLPQISDDVVLESYSAAAYYHGNMLQGAAGLMQINIFDKTYAEGEEGSGGYSVSLFVFNDLFSNPKDAVITPGEYKPATNFTWGTWMPAQEIPIGGGAIPIGTYAHRDDLAGGGMGSFSYAAAGQITISDAGDGQFTVEFDLESREGCVIKGSYTGEIPITDLSDDKSDDDGTSTLIRDYEMDLSHIKEASMHNRETTWIGWDYLPVKDYGCASQIINIGTEANPGYPEDAELDEKGYAHADIMRIELLVEPGTEGMITPGEYPVTPTRFPESFKPGVCARGIILGDEGVTGTRWMRVYSEYAYMEGHACIYDGSIIIEDAGNDEFEIRIKGICVRKHNVTGTWKGRILDGAGNPVKSSGKRVEAKQPRMPHTYPASAVLSAVPEKQNFASNRK